MKKIIIASGPVIVENNKVLLNKHGDTTFWKFCGGKVEDFTTTLEENARREVQEEMGIEVELIDQTPFFTYAQKEKDGELIDVILVHFLSKRVGEVNPGADIREWDWLDLDNLPMDDLAPNILPTLKHFGFLR